VVTIRRSGDIGVSADFVRYANIVENSRASIYLSRDSRKLALKFHSDEGEPDSFVLCQDGGRSNQRKRLSGRVLQVSSLRSKSLLYDKLSRLQSDSARRYRPNKQGGLWIVYLAPCFENTYRLRGELGGDDSGIYRYRLGGETVYIGRGQLSARFAAADRREWQFDTVEYSLLNDEAAEIQWESRWLEEFRAEHGRWPVYNRIGGLRLAAREDQEAGFG